MKQIIQSFKTGETTLENVPAPQVRDGTVLIQTSRSLISVGTEKMLVEFGKSNILSKARQQPDKVKKVLDKIRSEGAISTFRALVAKLNEPLPLGYCNVGKVIAVGKGVSEFNVGDRVASNGPHAEYVCIPVNLVAHIPDMISDEEATFTVIGSIGLQGIRLLNPLFGETVVVIGMGLIGLLTAQILIANGCKVIGIDIDDEKLELSGKWGVIPCNSATRDVVKYVETLTGSVGADGVIITAASKSNEIISQAARMSRKRGRIVLVGVIGLNINRAEFYEKELNFQVSCSYGPGRYDDNYEQRGNDYPLPYVRWTEKRNFEAVLYSIASGRIHLKEMITDVVSIDNYQSIYNKIGKRKSIASILKYDVDNNENPASTIELKAINKRTSKGVIGIIGAGNFTKMTMLPALKGSGACLKYIASAGGLSGMLLAKKFGIEYATTNYRDILNDNEIDLVVITTRHNIHASLTMECLAAGKHVFVEKPLAINNEQLEQIISVYQQTDAFLTVGFNRRFSAHSIKLKRLLGNGTMNVVATVNAGNIPNNVWVQDMTIGGGRIVGEACHFIDLITFFTGSKVTAVCMNAMNINPAENTDNATILLKYENGSTGVINYFSNGSKSYPKERIEVYSDERTAVIDNFRRLIAYGFKAFSGSHAGFDKGHKNQFAKLINCIQTDGDPLIPFADIINTTRASLAAIESLRTSSWIKISNL